MNREEKAKRFAGLHVKGAPLLLYNAWDAGSAQSVLEAGAKAIATSSWSVAAAQGYQDGEAIPIEFAEQIVGRIATSVDAPVTVDFEDDSELADNISRLIDLGVIGVNPTPPLWHPRRDRGQSVARRGQRTLCPQPQRRGECRQAARRHGPVVERAQSGFSCHPDLGADLDHGRLRLAGELERRVGHALPGALVEDVEGVVQGEVSAIEARQGHRAWILHGGM